VAVTRVILAGHTKPAPPTIKELGQGFTWTQGPVTVKSIGDDPGWWSFTRWHPRCSWL